MRYVEARFVEHQRELIYRIYITDILRSFVNTEENPVERYRDLIFPEKNSHEKTGDEIVNDVISSIMR